MDRDLRSAVFIITARSYSSSPILTQIVFSTGGTLCPVLALFKHFATIFRKLTGTLPSAEVEERVPSPRSAHQDALYGVVTGAAYLRDRRCIEWPVHASGAAQAAVRSLPRRT